MEDADLPILFVDDEPKVLDGLRRMLFDRFDVVTADSGDEALQFIASEGPFAVVVSDMRMPQMDGAELLSRVKILAPDTTRILLTGFSEVDAAIKAVNEGQIFRFLSKPCSNEALSRALVDGIRQYQLVTGERQLLEETLGGAVDVMTAVLELASPHAFTRARRVRRCAAHLAKEVGLADGWKLELAALLSSLGCIGVPTEVLDKSGAGDALTASEQTTFDAHPMVAYKLLSHIPRLHDVALLVLHQVDGGEPPLPGSLEQSSDLLRMAIAHTVVVERGAEDPVEAIKALRGQGFSNASALSALRTLKISAPGTCARMLAVRELKPGMTLAQDVLTPKGGVVVRAGREVTSVLIERLGNFARGLGVVEPIKVLVQSEAAEEDALEPVQLPATIA